MAFDRHVIDGKERLVWTCRAFDFRLFANPPLPFIRTGRCVAAAPRLAILPTGGEDIRTAAEKPSEQGNLVFDCRIPIDEIAGFFRRDNLDSSGLLTRCRLSSPLLSRLSLRKKPAISSIGIRQSKTRLPCSDGFSAAVRMSSPPVGRIARRGAAATHLPVRMNGSGGFAKSRKSNARHVQTRRSLPSMTCRSNAKSPRSLWAFIRC